MRPCPQSGRRVVFRWAGFGLMLVMGVRCLTPVPAGAQPRSDRVFDQILDQYVRDGLVYYAALRAERRAIDRHVESLAERPAGFDAWPEARRLAYWLNGYNALVLRTVIDHYPIRGMSAEFPENSVMQIPGVFSGREHRIAGRRLTLQAIEDELVAAFADPRAHLALGRGAVGSPRLLITGRKAISCHLSRTSAGEFVSGDLVVLVVLEIANRFYRQAAPSQRGGRSSVSSSWRTIFSSASMSARSETSAAVCA